MRHELHEFALIGMPQSFKSFVLIRKIRVSLENKATVSTPRARGSDLDRKPPL